jgi:DNA primase
MRRGRKIDALRSVLGEESFQRGDECIFFCPKHSHHKPKLSVNIATDHFNCWICGFKGQNLKPLLFFKGSSAAATEYSESIERSISATSFDDKNKTSFQRPYLPLEYKSLSVRDSSPYREHAIQFLKRRGIGDSEILRYKLGYCTEGEYNGRIIIPSFDSNGEINFFVGRKYYDHIGLSYKHGNFDKNIIFNDYLIDWDEAVTIVEGSFDAMAHGSHNTIPLQGTILNENSLLFAKIVTSGVRVYLALDCDAEAKQWKIMDSLTNYGVPVSMVRVGLYDFVDPSEMNNEQFTRACAEALHIDSTIGKLRWRASTL